MQLDFGTSESIHEQCAVRPRDFCAEAVSQKFDYLVVQQLTARAPASRAGKLFHAAAQSTKPKQLRAVLHLTAQFIPQAGKEKQFVRFTRFTGELSKI